MRRGIVCICLLAFLCAAAWAGTDDDFKRERRADNPEKGQAKDALENRVPPKLQVEDWMNTSGKPLDLAKLKGKVVVLDFWGVW